MGWETVLYKNIDAIAKITLNRPEKRNAQNMRLIVELGEAFGEADRDPEVRVIILCGNGPCFSAGHDLSILSPKSEDDDILDVSAARSTLEGVLRHEEQMYFDKWLAIRNLSKPTIAQVHGHCIGGGMMLAAMCDIIYASENATFSNPVLRATAASVEILFEPYDMGPRQAKELLFTADAISADEAHRLGFVNKVLPRQTLEDEVLTLARKIAVTPPVAVSLTKASINHTMDTMGQTNAWRHHFLVHVLSQYTTEGRLFREAHAKASALKNQFEDQEQRIRLL